MEHIEMVEKLRQKANVTYEEAKNALEASDWDILDALVLLESEGKVRQSSNASYSTEEKAAPKAEYQRSRNASEGFKKFFAVLGKIIEKGNKNNFVISYKNEEKIALPLTAFVPILCFTFPWWVFLGIAGLFIGIKYSFRGPDFGSRINDVMDKASDAAQSIKGDDSTVK